MKGRAEDRTRAVRVLFERYSGVIHGRCVRLLGDAGEAEDAVQETFINAYRSFERFRYGETPLPWLYRIATNVCFSLLRTRRRKRATPTATIDTLVAVTPNGPARVDARRLLQRLTLRLNKRDFQVMVAHHIDGMDQGQVAEMLGISRRTVVRRLAALREQLRELAEAVGGPEHSEPVVDGDKGDV